MRWAFSDRNAGSYLAQFFDSWQDLDQVNWDAVNSTDFRDVFIKEGKQAEFLLYEAFPWDLVEKIGVIDQATAQQVSAIVATTENQPPVCIESGWYY